MHTANDSYSTLQMCFNPYPETLLMLFCVLQLALFQLVPTNWKDLLNVVTPKGYHFYDIHFAKRKDTLKCTQKCIYLSRKKVLAYQLQVEVEKGHSILLTMLNSLTYKPWPVFFIKGFYFKHLMSITIEQIKSALSCLKNKQKQNLICMCKVITGPLQSKELSNCLEMFAYVCNIYKIHKDIPPEFR